MFLAGGAGTQWPLHTPQPDAIMAALLAAYRLQGLLAKRRIISFFRGKIFMTANSAKNMRILIMVLRDAGTESLDIPKYRPYSIFPKRQIATQKMNNLEGKNLISLCKAVCPP